MSLSKVQHNEEPGEDALTEEASLSTNASQNSAKSGEEDYAPTAKEHVLHQTEAQDEEGPGEINLKTPKPPPEPDPQAEAVVLDQTKGRGDKKTGEDILSLRYEKLFKRQDKNIEAVCQKVAEQLETSLWAAMKAAETQDLIKQLANTRGYDVSPLPSSWESCIESETCAIGNPAKKSCPPPSPSHHPSPRAPRYRAPGSSN